MSSRKLLELNGTPESLPTAWELTRYIFFNLIVTTYSQKCVLNLAFTMFKTLKFKILLNPILDQIHLVLKVFAPLMACLSPQTSLDNNFHQASTSKDCCKFCGQTQKNLLNHYRWTFEKNVVSSKFLNEKIRNQFSKI